MTARPRRCADLRASLAILAAIAALAGPLRRAAAYCRRSTCAGVAATVCTPAQTDDCGTPVRWPAGGLDYELAPSDDALPRAGAAAIERAFARWRDVDCGDGRRPDLRVATRRDGASPHATLAFTGDWPERGGGTFAVTRLWFAPSGRLLRGRVVFYTSQLAVHGPGAFLDSIALHEVGHLLGLAHSADRSAVMAAEVHDGTAARGELASDDVAGLCAIYPPRRSEPVWWALAVGSPVVAVAMALLLRRSRRHAAPDGPIRLPGARAWCSRTIR